ncbi:MAG: hypothetical protein HY289_14375 [Planctomycetes bacterium]|nr:hypothetical protein [Planctomycetota bacterium]
MRWICIWAGALVALPPNAWAGEPESAPKFTDLSKFVTALVVKQLPKQVEDASGWGQVTEIPNNLPLMGLRKTMKVADRLEAPHGAWRRFKGQVENPDKNFKLTILDFKGLDEKTSRIVMTVDVTVMCHGEWQQWQKGLLLVGADATADVNFTAAMVCDVGTSFNFKKFPPELNIEPRITEMKLDLVDFKLRGGPILKKDRGKALTNDFKDVLRGIVKASEPAVHAFANHALAEAVRDGKGAISASAILKALPAGK